MNEITVTKIVDEKGVITITVNGKDKNDYKNALQRELTGTTGGCGDGIWGNQVFNTISFGEYAVSFSWDKILSESMSAEEFATELCSRADRVRQWVDECKAKAHTETATIMQRETVVTKLDDENRLLYRRKNGTIATLD